MYTELGKFLRHLRIDNREILKDMAMKLGYSSAFLSAIETGAKKPPKDFTNKMRTIYKLSEEELEKFKIAMDYSLDAIEINLKNISHEKQNVGVLFARSFDSLDENIVKQIENLLKKEED